MHVRWVLPLLLLIPLAGCLDDTRSTAGGWDLDCRLGSYEAGPWSQDCLARASHSVGPKQELWLAINPTDPANVVLGAKDNNPGSSANCVWNGVYVTHDAGRTWTDVVIGGRYLDRTPGSPYYGYACNTDPMFAFAPDGTLHYNVELYNLGGKDGFGPAGAGAESGRGLIVPGWKSVLATSLDGGLTWPRAVDWTVGDGTASIPDYSRMAVTPEGHVVLAINSFDSALFAGGAVDLSEAPDLPVNAWFCQILRSLDAGLTAEVPVPVRHGATEGSFCMTVEAAPDGKLALAFQDSVLQEGAQNVTWLTSPDGESWSVAGGFSYEAIPPYFEENEVRTGANFEAAYAHHGPVAGRLYAVHAEQHEDADIVIRWSDDDGASWADPVRVDGRAGDQWLPNVAVAGDGSVHVFYFDKSRDPENRLVDVTHAISLDDGQSWTRTRVTDVAWDPDLGVHQEWFPFIGDYLGIDAVGNEVWGGFPDGSNGATTVAAAARLSR